MRRLHDLPTEVIFNCVRCISCSVHSERDQLIYSLSGDRAGYDGLLSPSLTCGLSLPDKFI